MNRMTKHLTVAATTTTMAMGAFAAGTSARTPNQDVTADKGVQPAQTAEADITSGPVAMKFKAQRPAGAPSTAATGFFEGSMSFGRSKVMDVNGPVTCLDVRQNKISLFYPITKSSPSLLSMAMTGVYVHLTTDRKGNVRNLTYIPVIGRTTRGCEPVFAALPAKGTASSTG